VRLMNCPKIKRSRVAVGVNSAESGVQPFDNVCFFTSPLAEIP
jgi:hypothetical protein